MVTKEPSSQHAKYSQGKQNKRNWKELGYPKVLPRKLALPHVPQAPTPTAAKEQIRKIVAPSGEPVTVRRGDGKEDAILNIIRTPDSLDDVHVTKNFIDHIIDEKNDHREKFAHYILPSLQDPEEVWLRSVNVGDRLVNRWHYLSAFKDINTVAVVTAMMQDGKNCKILWTFYPRTNINGMRAGLPIYRKKGKLHNSRILPNEMSLKRASVSHTE